MSTWQKKKNKLALSVDLLESIFVLYILNAAQRNNYYKEETNYCTYLLLIVAAAGWTLRCLLRHSKVRFYLNAVQAHVFRRAF